MKQSRFMFAACAAVVIGSAFAAGEGARSTGTAAQNVQPRRAAVSAAPVKLVENGVSQVVIAIDENASKPERYGAREIAKYLSKVTGCKETPILDRVDPAKWRGWQKLITISTLNSQPSTLNSQPSTLNSLKKDGFILDVSKSRISVIGQNPRGALYGCYEVLKRACGIRWLYPGDDDGEYFTPQKTVSLPEGRLEKNPYLPIRMNSSEDVPYCEWAARNYMEPTRWNARYVAFDLPSARERDHLEELAVSGQGRGGHIMTELMLGWGNEKESAKDIATRLYKEHPEYFPLIGGKRKMTTGPYDPNPCVSNTELIDRMARHMIAGLRSPHACDVNLIMGNNDTSVWCECDKCRALDAPEAVGTRGERSDRFWWFMNELAKRVWKELPEAKLGAWAYQDFWYPPKRVKIDPRLRVLISFNNQCWRHSVDDPNCPVNAEFRHIFGLWKETGLSEIYNRDEISNEGSPGRYEPSEYVVYRSLLAYPKYGCAGDHFCILSPGFGCRGARAFTHPPFPQYLDWAKGGYPYDARNYYWRAMWQTAYIAAQTAWDRDVDFAKTYEEINSLYYGKAWQGGMKEFRQYLTDCFTNTVGCIGYGSGAPIGKCLDIPGSQERLEGLLDKAELAAMAEYEKVKGRGEGEQWKVRDAERALRHVRTDRDIFRLTWLRGRKEYLDAYLESEAYQRKGAIAIDGEIVEKDWQDAKPIDDFDAYAYVKRGVKATDKTDVRVTYDLDTLYFAVTCYEPEMAKVRAGKPAEVDRAAGWKALGDHIEIFYQFPDMFDKAFHLAFNCEGALVDGLQKSASERDINFRTKAKWAAKKYADRWTLELAIPASEIGSKLMTGMDWRINVCRCPELKGGRKTLPSTCCHGNFYGVPNFMHLKLK